MKLIQPTHIVLLAVPLALSLCLCLPAHEASAGNAAGADPQARFQGFCASWMGKLRKRENHNVAQVRVERNGSGYVGRFTGYGRKPVGCVARPTGKSSTPYVGRLIYHEIEYEKAGRTQTQAVSASPREVGRVEVMELFRYNGSKWIY